MKQQEEYIENEESQIEDPNVNIEEEQDKEPIEEPKEEPNNRPLKALFTLLSGNFFQSREVTRYYKHLIVIAILFFLSISMKFWSLHLDMRHSQTSRHVQLLRERSVRLKEVRSSKMSNAAIESELKRRGIALQEANTPTKILD